MPRDNCPIAVLPKKCRDPRIFSVPCTIGECTFANAMLDLGASINVMPASIYRSLNFGDLEPTRMTIQLANRSIVQPLGVLKDVLVQVNNEDIEDSAGSIINCLESLEYTNNAEVKVAETKKPTPTQLATIFTAKTKSANEDRVDIGTKINSAKHSKDKADTENESDTKGRD
ncbi:hypothetical protein CR513_34593, partial [Mucuna pruriens]